MRIAKLSINGIEIAVAKTIQPTRPGGSAFYSIAHGGSGKGMWQIRIPINNQDLPADPKKPTIELTQDNFDLVVLDQKQDFHGNPGLIMRLNESDDRYLLLWDLSPGKHGGALYKLEGNAIFIAKGIVTEHPGTTRGQTECPVVMVYGPATLTWYRQGNIYGQPRAWCAKYDGKQWTIFPKPEEWTHIEKELQDEEELYDE